MGRHVFISYSQRDQRVASDVVDRLEREGHQVWIDRANLEGGMQWRPEVARNIIDCDCFVVLLFAGSVRSKHVIKELTLAEEENKAIIPVVISQTELTPGIKLQLVGTQRIDCTGDFERGLDQLLNAIPGAPARASATAARQDPTLTNDDTEFLGSMWDSAAIDSQREVLLEELVRIDKKDSGRGHGDPASDRRREELTKQLDELNKRGQKLSEKTRGMVEESNRLIASLFKNTDKKR